MTLPKKEMKGYLEIVSRDDGVIGRFKTSQVTRVHFDALYCLSGNRDVPMKVKGRLP